MKTFLFPICCNSVNVKLYHQYYLFLFGPLAQWYNWIERDYVMNISNISNNWKGECDKMRLNEKTWYSLVK